MSILILIPAFMIQKGYGHPWIDVSPDEISNIVPYLLLTTSVVFSMTSSFFSYVVNLYSVPGIQPDSFLVSMDFKILGSFTVSMSLSLVIIWFTPLGVQLALQRIRRKGGKIRTIPPSIVFLIVTQLIYTSINMVTRIPYKISFHVFILFFFGGLGLSYVFRVFMVDKFIEDNKRNVMLWTIFSGVSNAIFWFFFLMFVLFPNYLFEIGISSIL